MIALVSQPDPAARSQRISDQTLLNVGELRAALAERQPPLATLKPALQQAREQLRERFHMGVPVADLMDQRVWLVDQILVAAWDFFGLGPARLALVAVGGYGRGELHPGSDVDVLILLGQTPSPSLKRHIAEFVTLLWDIGLAIGHSVRSIRDCQREAKADVTVVTNLMECRLLAGEQALFDNMLVAIAPKKIWPARKFFEAKRQEQVQRHQKYQNTANNLEPNIKEGPGGLRDIHTIAWVAKRQFNAASLHDLVEHGFLTEAEFQSLNAGQNFLWRVRHALHHLTNRQEDRLLFEHQRALAQQFGFKDNLQQLAVEQFMRMYFRMARQIGLLNELLLQLVQESMQTALPWQRVKPLNRRFQIRGQALELSSPDILRQQPFAMLEVFLLLQHYPNIKGVRAATIRLIRDNLHRIDDMFRRDVRARSLFMEFLRQPDKISQELQRMHRYGVLGAYIPAFGAVVGLMQYDLFHVYTVDEHTLFVVRNLRRFATTAEEHQLCHIVMAQLPKPELAYLAGFFHDIAKGRGGDHSSLGAKDAYDFCILHGLSVYDAKLVAWLVQHHLVMSMTSQRQDISDPQVVTRFATLVGDRIHLNYLFVLTVADIRGTNPTLWNGWKDALLTELYESTLLALRRGLEMPIDKTDRIVEIQREALTLLGNPVDIRAGIERAWARLGEDYFLRHSAEEIAWHARHIANCKESELPLVLTHHFPRQGVTEIFVYTHNRDHLFAAATTVLDQLGLDIHDARIITSSDGFTLDSFIVLEDNGEPVSGAHRLREIVVALRTELARSALTPRRINRRPTRHSQHFPVPTDVSFTPDPGNQRTVMEVRTTDRPGVLSRIALAMRHCHARLINAKIATFGSRVEDVFYITDKHNKPIEDLVKFECLRRTITESLEQL